MLRRKISEAIFHYPFWDRPEQWPHNPPGYVFLARAFNEVGAAVYRSEWAEPPDSDDKEPEEPEEPAEGADKQTWVVHDQEYNRYEQACEKARVNCERMWANVVRLIAEACEAGTLISAARSKLGGKMKELEPHYWNMENYKVRFARCEMSLKSPFADRFSSSEACCVYVTRQSLQKYIEAKTAESYSVLQNSIGESSTEPSKIRGRSGRTKGSGSWERADEPLLEKMRDLIKKGIAKSPHNAAGKVAIEANGAGTVESKQSRLEKAYRKKFPAGEK